VTLLLRQMRPQEPSRGRHWAAVRDAASMAGDFPDSTPNDGERRPGRKVVYVLTDCPMWPTHCLPPGQLFDLLANLS